MQTSFRELIRQLAIVSVIGAGTFATAFAQQNGATAQAMRETPAQLQQLVAPIALYPDQLVAQILAASTYPTQIVAADRWLAMNNMLPSEQLAVEVDQQPWDPSVKALTAFPTIVANLDMNLSWATELGKVYFTQPQDVLDAVQVMRRRAQVAGNLQSTPQQNVTTQGSTIIIQPVAPNTCYLPFYDPWIVYGAPLGVYPGYIYEPWYGPPYIAFGPPVVVGFFGRFGWGWPAWGFNWNQRVVVFNRVPYVARGPVFVGGFGGFRSGPVFRSGPIFHHFDGGRSFRGFEGRGFRGGWRR